MSNNLLTNDIILKTALMEFENNLVLAKTVRRDYQNKFNATTGDTIRIRKPTRYVSRSGRTLSVQDINEQYTNMTIAYQDGVDVEVTSKELALQLDDFNRDILNPAMETLANKVDSRLYDLSTQFSNFAGTAGTAPNSFSVANQCNAVLNRFGIPRKDRFLLMKTDDAATLQSALYNTFNEKFNKDIIIDGSMGNLASFDVYDVQNAIRPSRGSASLGTPAINGAGQSGSTLALDGFTASIQLKAGAVFTIAGVNSVNPVSRVDTGQLAQFVVTADTSADGSGVIAALPVQVNGEPIVLTGPYQNVASLPADNALLTFQATHTKNLFYHREAFALAVVPMPVGANGAYQKNMIDEKAKVSLRMSRQYDITNDQDIIRFDILYGVKAFPQYGGILMGS